MAQKAKARSVMVLPHPHRWGVQWPCTRFSLLIVFHHPILYYVRCERSDGEASVSSLRIPDEIALLKRRVVVAEDLLEAAAKALQQASVEVSPAVLRIST